MTGSCSRHPSRPWVCRGRLKRKKKRGAPTISMSMTAISDPNWPPQGLCSRLHQSADGAPSAVRTEKKRVVSFRWLAPFLQMASGWTSEPGSGCSSRAASPHSSPNTSPRTLAARVLSGMVEDDPPQIGGHMIAFQHASNFSSSLASLQMLGHSFMAQDRPSAPPPPARRPAPYPQRPVCPTLPSKLPRDVTPCAPLHAPLHAPSARCAPFARPL